MISIIIIILLILVIIGLIYFIRTTKAKLTEIDRINQSKKDSLMNFIESSNKNLAIRNEKNRVIGSIKKFIFGKFNTYKYIYDTIITPFNNRMNDYIENELKDMKSN